MQFPSSSRRPWSKDSTQLTTRDGVHPVRSSATAPLQTLQSTSPGDSKTSLEASTTSGSSSNSDRDVIIISIIIGASVFLAIAALLVVVACSRFQDKEGHPSKSGRVAPQEALPKTKSQLDDGKENFRYMSSFHEHFGEGIGRDGPMKPDRARYATFEMPQHPSPGHRSRLGEGTPEERQTSAEHAHGYCNTRTLARTEDPDFYRSDVEAGRLPRARPSDPREGDDRWSVGQPSPCASQRMEEVSGTLCDDLLVTEVSTTSF